MDLLESFIEHWRGITGYYLETTGEWGVGRGERGLGGFLSRIGILLSPGWGLCKVGIKSLCCGNRSSCPRRGTKIECPKNGNKVSVPRELLQEGTPFPGTRSHVL